MFFIWNVIVVLFIYNKFHYYHKNIQKYIYFCIQILIYSLQSNVHFGESNIQYCTSATSTKISCIHSCSMMYTGVCCLPISYKTHKACWTHFPQFLQTEKEQSTIFCAETLYKVDFIYVINCVCPLFTDSFKLYTDSRATFVAEKQQGGSKTVILYIGLRCLWYLTNWMQVIFYCDEL